MLSHRERLWPTISKRVLGIIGILTLLQCGLAPHAQAIPDYLEAWKIRYGKTAMGEATCLVCHTMPKGLVLNSYGKDLFQAGLMNDMFAKTEPLDSDKDGFSNIDEIRAGTLPGNAKSVPFIENKKATGEASAVKKIISKPASKTR